MKKKFLKITIASTTAAGDPAAIAGLSIIPSTFRKEEDNQTAAVDETDANTPVTPAKFSIPKSHKI